MFLTSPIANFCITSIVKLVSECYRHPDGYSSTVHDHEVDDYCDSEGRCSVGMIQLPNFTHTILRRENCFCNHDHSSPFWSLTSFRNHARQPSDRQNSLAGMNYCPN